MNVQDRIQAMNKKKEERHEDEVMEEQQLALGEKSYPKRSSVVEMWKKREGSIKAISIKQSYKFEEKKENLDDDDSDRDARQQEKSPTSAFSSFQQYDPRTVTPERSGPESSSEEDAGSPCNVEGSFSSGSGLGRRSNVRDTWKKRTANVSSPASFYASSSAGKVTETVPLSATATNTTITTATTDSYRSSPEVTKQESSEARFAGGQAVATSPSPLNARENSWRRRQETKDQPDCAASAATTTSRNSSPVDTCPDRDGGSNAFDELRLKWAKFGVQKAQARESAAKPSTVTSRSTFSSKSPSMNASPTPDQPRKETSLSTSPIPDLPPKKENTNYPLDEGHPAAASTPSCANPVTPIVQRHAIPVTPTLPITSKMEEIKPTVSKESLVSTKSGDGTPSKSASAPQGETSRKSHFVKLGQMHASRPKADSNFLIKRHNQIKYSPKRGTLESGGTSHNQLSASPGPAHSSNNYSSSSNNKKNSAAESNSELRAKYRRRVSPSFLSKSPGASDLSERSDSQTEELFSADSFPVDETTDPETVVGKPKRMDPREKAIRASLPMRTLFGSLSEETVAARGAGSNSAFHKPSPPGVSLPRSNATATRTRNAEVTDPMLDSWSDILSVSKEESVSKEDKVSSPAAGRAHSSSTLTGSALKKLKELRQKHQPPSKTKVDDRQNSISKATTSDCQEDAVTQPFLCNPCIPGHPGHGTKSAVDVSMHTRTHEGYLSALSLDTAKSPSLCSEASYTNSPMQSTYTSGFTTETPSSAISSKKSDPRSPLHVPDASEMVPDEFVSEKNANVQSFQTAYESMSLEQIAKDMQEEAGSVFNFNILNNDLLNKGMYAAGESLNKLVGGDMFQKRSPSILLLKRAPSPVEEVAIEVEYIADSDDEGDRRRR